MAQEVILIIPFIQNGAVAISGISRVHTKSNAAMSTHPIENMNFQQDPPCGTDATVTKHLRRQRNTRLIVT